MDLSTLSSTEGHNARQENYKELILSLVKQQDQNILHNDSLQLLNTLVSTDESLIVSRSVMSEFVGIVSSLPHSQSKKILLQNALDVAEICELLASYHEQEEDFESAARVLLNINLESGQRQIAPKDKVKTYIRIIRDYLEVDDTVSADRILIKSSSLFSTSSDIPSEYILHFRLSQARVLDSQRKFQDAALKYYELSLSAEIAQEERLHCLGAAVICVVLSPGSQTRSRLLVTMFKDERKAELDPIQTTLLEKLYMESLVTPDELEEFAKLLKPHQLATVAEGGNVLTSAIREQNLLSASKIYTDISLSSLGALLGVDTNAAEFFTARMIRAGRLNASIDQIDGLVWFESNSESNAELASIANDQRYERLLQSVEEVSAEIMCK